MNMKIFLTGSAITLGAALSISTPASAQQACDLNGAAQVPPAGLDTLTCGTAGVFSFSTGDNSTAVGVDSNIVFDSATAVGSNSFAGSIASAGTSLLAGYFPPTDIGATAVGAYSFAGGQGAVAIGDEAGVGLLTANANGSFSISGVDFGTAIGSQSLVTASGGMQSATIAGFRASMRSRLAIRPRPPSPTPS